MAPNPADPGPFRSSVTETLE